MNWATGCVSAEVVGAYWKVLQVFWCVYAFFVSVVNWFVDHPCSRLASDIICLFTARHFFLFFSLSL